MKNDNNEGEAAGGGYWSGGWGLAGVEGGDAVLGVRFENPHRGPLLSSIFIIWQVWHAATITGLSRAQLGNEDLFLLNLRLAASAILARIALSAEAACRIVCST